MARLIKVSLTAIAVSVAACGQPRVGGDPEPVTAPSSTAPTTTTPAPVSSTTPATATSGPVAVSIVWDCEELEGGGGRFSCTTGDDTDRFRQGYWNITVTIETDSGGVPVSLSGAGSGYNGFCMWQPESGFEGPINDGLASIDHVLVGTGVCEGEVFTFDATWDLETKVFTMDGVIEPST